MLVQEFAEPALSRTAAHWNEGQLKNQGDQEIDEVAPDSYEHEHEIENELELYRPDS